MSDRILDFKATIDPELENFFNQILKDKDFIETNHTSNWDNILPKLINHLTLILKDYFNVNFSYVVRNPILANIQDPETIENFSSRLITKLKSSFPDSPPFTILHLVNILSFNIPVLFELNDTSDSENDEPIRHNHQACKLLRSLERCIFVQSSIKEVDQQLERLGSKNTTKAINEKIIRKLKNNKDSDLMSEFNVDQEYDSDDNENKGAGQTMVRISWLHERTDQPLVNEEEEDGDKINENTEKEKDMSGILENSEHNGDSAESVMSTENDLIDQEIQNEGEGEDKDKDKVMEILNKELMNKESQIGDDTENDEDEDIEELSLGERSSQDLSSTEFTESDLINKSPRILFTNHNTSLDESSILGNNIISTAQSPKRNEKEPLDQTRLLKKSRSSNNMNVLAKVDDENDIEENKVILDGEEMNISTPEKKIVQN